MADQAVPEHGLEGLGQGRDPARVDLGDEDDHIAVLGGVALFRPTIPNIFAKRDLAKSIAWTMLALILRSASPPPTE
jgi:hypothetical protein